MQEPAQLVSLGGVHHKSVAGKPLGILATFLSYLHSYLLIPLLSSLLMGSFTAYFIQEKKYQRKIKSSSTKTQILLASAAMFSFLSCHSGWKVLLAVRICPAPAPVHGLPRTASPCSCTMMRLASPSSAFKLPDLCPTLKTATHLPSYLPSPVLGTWHKPLDILASCSLLKGLQSSF